MKKIFTLIAAALMTIGASAQTTTVGAEDNTSGWWTAFSDYYTIQKDQTLHLEFTNYTSKGENWHNFVFVLANAAGHSADPNAADYAEGYKEYFAVRADNFGWGDCYNTAILESNWNWDIFKDVMDGAYVKLDVARNGANIVINADVLGSDGISYFQKYTITITEAEAAVVGFLTTEKGHFVIEDSKTKTLPVIFDDWGDNILIKKTGVKAGDQFKFTAEAYAETGDAATWQWGPQLLMKSNEDWSDLSMSPVTPDNNYTFTMSAEDADKINNFGGLRIQGMGVKLLDWEFIEGQSGGGDSNIDEIALTDFSTWNPQESVETNADGTLTFHAVSWGGLSKWLGTGDWSAYDKLVYEFAAPTTVDVQPFVQYVDPAGGADGINETNYTAAGVTEASINLNAELKGAVKQFALQAAAAADIVVKRIYLVKSATGIQNVKMDETTDDAWYTLSGVRVAAPQKGIYIHNGKKVMVLK
ncbi:MAG: hypothetical protein K5893_02215 [Prevotella sp.]|nr:hypothetical protein [Prevotella sp.]